MKFICFLKVSLVLTILNTNAQSSNGELPVQLRNGDLLFCGASSGKLSRAIDEVTQTGHETHFSHIALIEMNGTETCVLHAAPEKGVVREPLGQFLSDHTEYTQIVVYRLKDELNLNLAEALRKANGFIGQEYNFSYILEDKGMYCSEFIYEIFASDSVFQLNPMTFKNPVSGEFSAGWIDHYAKLGIEIPEGLPGCNPNGMAASDKLRNVGELKRRHCR